MSELIFRERPAAGDPAGLLVLHHGRGADEHDLLGLADVLDPQRRLHVVTPRAPLTLPGWPGHHWYVVPRVGYPDPDTFRAAYAQLAAFHDELWERTGVGPERTVFGGFSMGSVMSYALGLGADRPAPAGILAFSGFVPTVEGWAPALAGREGTRVFIAHGRHDPVMAIDFARRARDLIAAGGLPVEYHESDAAHHIDPAHVPAAKAWLGGARSPVGMSWPPLPYADWEPTKQTLHRYAQMVGKVRMALVPPRNHWWHVTLYVSARGLTTGPMPAGDATGGDRARLRRPPRARPHAATGAGRASRCATGSPCARFYDDLFAALGELGVEVGSTRARSTSATARRSPRTRSTTATTRTPSRATGRSCAPPTPCSTRSARASPARRARCTSSGTASTSRTRATRAAARPPSPAPTRSPRRRTRTR